MPRHSLSIVVSARFNRIVVPELDAELIDKPWKQKMNEVEALAAAGHPAKLFNGTKFRLDFVDCVEEDRSADRRVHLSLGITDYRTSLGCGEAVQAYRAHCSSTTCDQGGAGGDRLSVERFLPQALGIESMVVTSDNYAVLFRRSKHVAEMPGWYCCPGGHPEPRNILSSEASSKMTLDEQASWFEKINSDIVGRELWDSAIDEVVAELGIAASSLRNIGLLGIVQHAITCKPDLISLVRTSLSSAEVKQQFDLRVAEESFESDEGSCLLLRVSKEDIDDAVSLRNITPASVACLRFGLAAIERGA